MQAINFVQPAAKKTFYRSTGSLNNLLSEGHVTIVAPTPRKLGSVPSSPVAGKRSEPAPSLFGEAEQELQRIICSSCILGDSSGEEGETVPEYLFSPPSFRPSNPSPELKSTQRSTLIESGEVHEPFNFREVKKKLRNHTREEGSLFRSQSCPLVD